jgi:hypothetical protein
MLLRAGDGITPCLWVRGIAGIQVFDAFEVERVVAGEGPDPWKTANVYADGADASGRIGGLG